MGCQWHQLDHMQIICILLQTDNHASTSPLSYRPDALPATQPTASVVVVLNWECWLTQVVLYNGHKTVVVGSFLYMFQTLFSDFDGAKNWDVVHVW